MYVRMYVQREWVGAVFCRLQDDTYLGFSYIPARYVRYRMNACMRVNIYIYIYIYIYIGLSRVYI